MNYKDYKGLNNEVFYPIAHIQNYDGSTSFYIYKIFDTEQGEKAICSIGKEGTKEIYDIKTIDFDNVTFDFELVGKIIDNKIYGGNSEQGYVYKNKLAFRKTIELSDEEIDKLPLKDKICYVPENAFERYYIDLSKDNLIEGEDYCTVKSIKQDIEDYFGKNITNQISDENMKDVIESVFEMLDWQYPFSLLDADQYLDGFVSEILGIDLNGECEVEEYVK